MAKKREYSYNPDTIAWMARAGLPNVINCTADVRPLTQLQVMMEEVPGVVNKIRSEVDPEAEIINGSIIDPSLEGKIRVSIVATSLDGQQPESKSVINMVHRIQNRNPGYSDFTTADNSTSFNFSNANSNPVSHGANALKLENEVVSENTNMQTVDEVNNQYHEELLKNQEAESIVEKTSNDNEISFSQEAINTIIGKDYPLPIVIHEKARASALEAFQTLKNK